MTAFKGPSQDCSVLKHATPRFNPEGDDQSRIKKGFTELDQAGICEKFIGMEFYVDIIY
jgi:hypothetical protein